MPKMMASAIGTTMPSLFFGARLGRAAKPPRERAQRASHEQSVEQKDAVLGRGTGSEVFLGLRHHFRHSIDERGERTPRHTGMLVLDSTALRTLFERHPFCFDTDLVVND